MSIWVNTVTPEQLNLTRKETMVSNLGIEFTEIGEDSVTARDAGGFSHHPTVWNLARWRLGRPGRNPSPV